MQVLLSLKDFNQRAKMVEVMSYRHVFMDFKNEDDDTVLKMEGYDKIVLNAEGLCDIRARLESPAVKHGMQLNALDRLAAIDPQDLEVLRVKLLAEFGEAGWSDDPLGPVHVFDILKRTDAMLESKFEYAAGFPSELEWEIETPTPYDEMKALEGYKWTAGLNRLRASFESVLPERFEEISMAHISFRVPETRAELATAATQVDQGALPLQILRPRALN